MGSSCGDVPAESAAAAVSDLMEAREGVERLRSFLQQLDKDSRAPWAELVADGVLSRLSSAMAALNGSAGEGQISPAAAGSRRQQPAVVSSGGNTRKRSFTRRSRRFSGTSVTDTLEDGHVWRKYGQKEIQNSPHPRSYYRCTHRTDQGCSAKRHVQLCDTDASKHVITYFGEHTCRDPSSIPFVVHVAGAAADGAKNNLISFTPASCANATSAGAASSSQLANDGSASQLSTSWCTSDDVFSSSGGSFMQVDGELGAVVGSAVVMPTTQQAGSAQDSGGLGEMTRSGGGSSFPSSPASSLGFMVGSSLGSIEDDEFFRFGPT